MQKQSFGDVIVFWDHVDVAILDELAFQDMLSEYYQPNPRPMLCALCRAGLKGQEFE